MAIESAKAFIERIKTDREFRDKIGGAKDKEERASLVTDAGFNFTIEELKEAGEELTDEDLELVVGGMACGHFDEYMTSCAYEPPADE